jgi:methyltransferase (TIGR00027 family)
MARRPPAAQTAFGPMVIAAVEQFGSADRRLVHDPLAMRFLPPAMALVVRAARWRWWRNQLIRVTDGKALGIWGGMLCRKRYADDQVRAALDAGIDQLVVLGAGMDTRAYRLADPAGVRAYEVDLPANIDTKRARVRAAVGEIPEHVRLVPVDLETTTESDDLAESLTANGFRFDRPAMFVWEAVTQYLTEDAVRHTLALLAKTASGSRLVFTYLRRDFLDGTNTYQAQGAYQDFVVRHRIWHFGLNPEQVAPLLDEYRWTEQEQVGAAEYQQRYLEATGRHLPVSEIERFVLATRS